MTQPANDGGLLQTALSVVELDVPVFPLRAQSKLPLEGRSWKKDATTKPAILRAIWNLSDRAAQQDGAPGTTSYGILWSGLIVDGDDPLRVDTLEATFPELAEAPTVVTPRGGRHWYLRWDGAPLPTRAEAQDHVDVRGFGKAYVVGPGSQIVDDQGARSYTILRPLVRLEDAPLASAALREYLSPRKATRAAPEPVQRTTAPAGAEERWAAAALAKEAENVRTAQERTRNDTLNQAALNLGQIVAAGLLDEAQVRAELMAAAQTAGLAPSAAAATITSGMTKGKTEPRRRPAPARKEAAQQRAGTPTRPPYEPPMVTMRELLARDLQPIAQIVEGLVVPGLNVLAGKPKMGKSWLALQLALAVASGQPVWNRATQQGRALYFGLEDSERRLQNRLAKMTEQHDYPAAADQLICGVTLPRLDAGGAAALKTTLERYPDTQLVVLDTLARIKSASPAKGNAYDADSLLGDQLQAIAKEHGIALLVVTHMRKMAADDPLDAVSGSLGLTGAADSVLLLTRKRGEGDAMLRVTSRDMDEREDALRWNAESGHWEMLGSAADYNQSRQRRAILEAVQELCAVGQRAGPASVAKHLEGRVAGNVVRQLMARMATDGILRANGRGDYAPANDARANTVANVAFVAKPLPYKD